MAGYIAQERGGRYYTTTYKYAANIQDLNFLALS